MRPSCDKDKPEHSKATTRSSRSPKPLRISGIIIDLESSVKAAYGDAIEAVIRDACREAGIEDAEVDVRDKGALDCTIRARTLTAITRAGL